MSRYHTLYNTAGAAKWTTISTGAVSTNTSVTARRISVVTYSSPHFVAFGTSTVVASTASFIVPANTVLDFNVTSSATHVAAICPAGASYITVLDAD